MSWKRHFSTYQGKKVSSAKGSSGSVNKFQSWLPEVYTGQPNRVDRYLQYDQMDMDSEVNAALDTISEFSTQFDEETNMPFKIMFKSDATESEIKILETTLTQWCSINDWDKRIFKTFRNVIKYGDQPFVRDPETWVLHYVEPMDVLKVVINEAKGKKPEQYIIKNLALNIHNKTAAEPINHNNNFMGAQSPQFPGSTTAGGYTPAQNNDQGNLTETPVNSEHVMHVALTEGMDIFWPFGTSILDSIFKTYKQKELLEDSIIIYRVQRAPERRVFYIDTGNMPPHKANAFIERVKNDIHQKRIPNKSGGGASLMDAQYNPMSMLEDYFFAQTADGRGSKVEVLPGGDNLGDIDDLKFFTNKMMRALRIPSSYMPTGPEDGTASINDGKVGTAFIQEFRFTKYCQRIQGIIAPVFDREFKLFMKARGITIESSLFDLQFVEPQSFSQYRQIEIDSERASLFNSLENTEYLSRRFILGKYLGLTESEILENERMWKEENKSESDGDSDPSLSDVDVRPELDGGDFGGDDFGDEEFGDEEFGDDDFGDFGDDESPIAGDER